MIRTLHRSLAIALGLFILLHLSTHLFALAGPEAHNRALKSVQWVYRNRFVEPLLLAAIAVQIGAGLRLMLRRLREPGKGFWGWAQIASGVALGVFFVLHASAALMARHLFHIDTNFYWPGGSLTTPPLQWWFVPYYFIGALAVFTHVAAALHFRFGASALAPKLLIGAGAAYGATIILTFSGAFFDFTLPDDYVRYFDYYLDQLGLK
ncbi:MAG: hypothetical protein R3C58_02400 [Parvularculaceae bacterium]